MNAIKLFSSALILGLSFISNAQIIVKVKPVAPRHAVVVSKVSKPHGHVWVAGGWVVKGNTYVWQDGYYTKHKPGYIFVEGYWKKNRHGWVWVPGKWRRVR